MTRPDAIQVNDTQTQAFGISHTSGSSGRINGTGGFRSFGVMAATGTSEELCDDGDKSDHDGGSTASEDNIQDLLDFEDGWEAPHPDLPDESEMPVDLDTEMTNPLEEDSDVNSGANERTNHHTHTTSQQTQGKETFIDRYPGDTAGHPTPKSAGAPLLPNANRCYAEQLEGQMGGAGQCPYWPFTSQLDWEVAHWAKMRGPGSTAVSELLSINGVSLTDSNQCKFTHKLCLRSSNSACEPNRSLLHQLT
ncbi:hypothetical protein JVU11DRAFT_4549 [Chiua virens]|nr:hypothetical protein JVU11DRAFT_4549 [Chiua virens]